MKSTTILLIIATLVIINSCGSNENKDEEGPSKEELKIEEFENYLIENKFEEAKEVLEELEQSKYTIDDDELLNLYGKQKNAQFVATIEMINQLIDKESFDDAQEHQSNLFSYTYEDDQITESSKDLLLESMVKLNKAKEEYLNPYKEKFEGKLNDLKNVSDEFSDVKWMKDPSSTNYTNESGFFLYFGLEDDGLTPLRLRIQYLGDDWLFINGFVLLIDGEKYPLIAEDMDRDNGSGEIWEWSDEALDNYSQSYDMKELMVKIINSDETKIKFVGDQYYDTRSITTKEKKALKNVLLGYLDAGGFLKIIDQI